MALENKLQLFRTLCQQVAECCSWEKQLPGSLRPLIENRRRELTARLDELQKEILNESLSQ